MRRASGSRVSGLSPNRSVSGTPTRYGGRVSSGSPEKVSRSPIKLLSMVRFPTKAQRDTSRSSSPQKKLEVAPEPDPVENVADVIESKQEVLPMVQEIQNSADHFQTDTKFEFTERLDVDLEEVFKKADQKEIKEKKRLRDLPSIIRGEKKRLKELYEEELAKGKELCGDDDREVVTLNGQWSPSSRALLQSAQSQDSRAVISPNSRAISQSAEKSIDRILSTGKDVERNVSADSPAGGAGRSKGVGSGLPTQELEEAKKDLHESIVGLKESVITGGPNSSLQSNRNTPLILPISAAGSTEASAVIPAKTSVVIPAFGTNLEAPPRNPAAPIRSARYPNVSGNDQSMEDDPLKSPIREANFYYQETPHQANEAGSPNENPKSEADKSEAKSEVDKSDISSENSDASTRNPLEELDLALESVDHVAKAKKEAGEIFNRTLKRVKEQIKDMPGVAGDGDIWNMNRLFAKGKMRLLETPPTTAPTTAAGSKSASGAQSSAEGENNETDLSTTIEKSKPRRNMGMWNHPVEFWEDTPLPYDTSSVTKLQKEMARLAKRYPGSLHLHQDYIGMDALGERAKDEKNALLKGKEARLRELEGR